MVRGGFQRVPGALKVMLQMSKKLDNGKHFLVANCIVLLGQQYVMQSKGYWITMAFCHVLCRVFEAFLSLLDSSCLL